jgi:hypothetical protein
VTPCNVETVPDGPPSRAVDPVRRVNGMHPDFKRPLAEVFPLVHPARA